MQSDVSSTIALFNSFVHSSTFFLPRLLSRGGCQVVERVEKSIDAGYVINERLGRR